MDEVQEASKLRSSAEDAAWAAHTLPLERAQARLVALLATLLVPAWIPFDFILEPTLAREFLVYRALDVALGVVILLRLRRAGALREVRVLAMAKLVATGGVIALMLPQVTTHYWPYVLGFSLVIWGAAVVLSFPVRAVAVGLALVIAAPAVALLLYPELRTLEELVGGGFYVVSAYIICLSQILLRRRLERRAFLTGHRLAEASRKVIENEEQKSRFFANVSHELRTPLALILGPAERAAADQTLSPERRQDVDVVVRNARTLLRHVNNLLEVARLDAKETTLSLARVDVARLVRTTAAHFDAIAAERGLAFTVDAAEEAFADVDPDKLARVLLNLLSNAFKFTPDGGRVRCALRSDAERVTLTVADSGPGIKPADRDVVFDRFRQLDGGTTRRFGGTGLGLSIVKELVALHGGDVHVEDADEGGAAFVCRLPTRAKAGARVRVVDEGAAALVADDVLVQGAADVVAPVGMAPDDAQGDAPLVLVVEDNVDMNAFVRRSLGAGFRTVAALDGRAGLDKALAERPDLVVTDVMMPVMSGDDLVRELRRRPELDDVPILVLTAKADDPLRVQLLQQGAQDYVMKPFSPDELRVRAENLVGIKRARDALQSEVATKGQSLELLAKENARRRRELATALDAAWVARAQAEEASRVKSRFLELVSHELRTPLTTLQLQLERLERARREPLPPGAQGQVARISRAMNRLGRLVESLLEHARIQSGRLVTQVEAFDLRALAHEVEDELSALAQEKGLALEVVDGDEAPPLVSDPRIVRLIVLNLVGNAIKFTERGHVRIRLSYDDHVHLVAVEDTGPGIPAQERQRILEPFERTDEARARQVPGVGLGLALVKDMVGALGGEIVVDSTERVGSCFTVRLPDAHVAQDAARRTVLARGE